METDLQEMIRENFVAERIAIETYTEIVRWIGESDPTSRRLIEDILKEEEDHADELNDLYQPSGSMRRVTPAPAAFSCP